MADNVEELLYSSVHISSCLSVTSTSYVHSASLEEPGRRYRPCV